MFGKNCKKKDGLQTYCKPCQKSLYVDWYARNREAQKERVRVRKERLRRRAQEKVVDYLLAHPCVDCGETNVLGLEFDHREPAEKECGVNVLVHGGYEWPPILAEIRKCDVRWRPCRVRRTSSVFRPWR